ncbi:MAG: 50S ribosomal protein L11 methyltransferase [Wenzhouxiangella sp.]
MTDSPNRPDWLTIRIHITSAQVEAFEDGLFDAGASAVTLLDAEDNPVHEPAPGEVLLWPDVVIEALFEANDRPERIRQHLIDLGLTFQDAQFKAQTLAGQDWERAWMDSFKPMRFGQGLWICPSHVEPEPDWPRVIRLDPGLAFGSGTHPTTALCLEWLDGQDCRGQQVLDFGCGSGILAIAAALDAADTVVAVDHDPQALQATRDNAERNEVSARIQTCLPDDFQPRAFNVVLANILAGPLIELAPMLVQCLAPGARLVLSGILREQAEAVCQAYRSALGEARIQYREDWTRLEFTAPEQAE